MYDLINIKSKQGKLTVSSREVSENFEKRHSDVLEKIKGLTIEIEPTENSARYFIESEYKDSKGEIRKEYQITRDGFSLLVMGFTGTKAFNWKLKYIEAFNKMELTIKNETEGFSPMLQVLMGIEIKQKAHDKALNEVSERLDNITDIVGLNSSDWRNDSRKLISKIAIANGDYQETNAKIYKLLETRFGVSLSTRLTNKRRRMAEEGASQSRRDKLTRVDVIAEDKKLVEGYLAIVKEMAIKHGVVREVSK